jgi:tetratricopeptide (TPR) repeat protein
MATATSLDAARDAFARQAWSASRSTYAALADDPAMTLDDLERYAIAAHLVGEESESREVLARGYQESVNHKDVTRAARFAFFRGHSMIFTGEIGQANGWFTRARNALAERGADCVEWGYLLVPQGIEHLMEGDPQSACAAFTEAQLIGRRFADPTLVATAGHGRGRSLIHTGQLDEGLAVLDEVMVSVAANEVSPLLVGDIYCGVLEACQELFDLRRAREWTSLLSRWCQDQPDLVPYRGPCLIHRIEIMRQHGDWDDALEEAQRACDWLSLPASPEGPADAFYQLGELYRLRGNFDAAEEAYRQASRLGRQPEPGLALLCLARGQASAAAAAMRRALEEPAGDHPLGEWDKMLMNARRAELLSGYVEVLLATGELAEARDAADQLEAVATALDVLPLRALADRAVASVHIASGDPRTALAPLRRSWSAWRKLDVRMKAPAPG